ncbi:hypothetical protein DM82_1361 [Burkholderia oklahomensis]|uniref:Uncharacterized protein n=1 Tax=Burkholderia oklahomensis TaxID=342113 RepID=A0AAI8FM44_9BURK|nr:hypothetical protein DM82_1361 [Burkholderia oklahomensis]
MALDIGRRTDRAPAITSRAGVGPGGLRAETRVRARASSTSVEPARRDCNRHGVTQRAGRERVFRRRTHRTARGPRRTRGAAAHARTDTRERIGCTIGGRPDRRRLGMESVGGMSVIRNARVRCRPARARRGSHRPRLAAVLASACATDAEPGSRRGRAGLHARPIPLFGMKPGGRVRTATHADSTATALSDSRARARPRRASARTDRRPAVRYRGSDAAARTGGRFRRRTPST